MLSMDRARLVAGILIVTGCLLAAAAVSAQDPMGHEQDPVPPPVPPKPVPKDTPEYEPLVPESDLPWGLSEELIDPLFDKADVYADYTKRFVCTETARMADYNETGDVKNERVKRYGYLLVSDATGLHEYRQQVAKDGSLKDGAVKDEETFPPAYAWVFLFSRFNEPYFAFRYIGDRFDGFDWIHEIEFKGSVPFSHGKDIRQWQGTVLVDAVTYTPIEIQAEPAGQRDRIEALYRNYTQSFKLLGMGSKPKPLGYRANIQFRHRLDGLSFPTELRYDTFEAVSINQIVPRKASTRFYDDYRITRTSTTQKPGDKVDR
jgi:hypothetical protein